MILDGTSAELRMRLRGSSLVPTAIPLPTDLASWTPTRVWVDGKPATAIRRDGGYLWVTVPKGVFAIVLSGPTLRRESIQIPLPTVWSLEVGPSWHGTFAGIPPLLPIDPAGQHHPEWRLWPGEEARITLEKPTGAPGQSLTIDGSTLALTPGARLLSAKLAIALRDSRGTEHQIQLPLGAVVESIVRDGSYGPTNGCCCSCAWLPLAISPPSASWGACWA